MEPFSDCDYRSPDLEAFDAQAPQSRVLDRDKEPQTYSPIIRADKPSPSLSQIDLYRRWLETGKIFTVRHGSTDIHYCRKLSPYSYEKKECVVLFEAYKSAASLGDAAADFRDALVDAMAEFLDDHGIDLYPWEAFHAALAHVPGSQMKKLLAFFFVLNIRPCSYNAIFHFAAEYDMEFREMVAAEHLRLEACGKTYRSVWEAFMQSKTRDGRCQFHEHASNECWRAGKGKIQYRL
ncbi:hypothetical protein K505DRAFT_324667 [Melanomma pulvis-pyrius CBS 109.77]|uniref:Uncharacterized protein n=1 Tax=Melanomma pulvis-pyrius CBS 109.77 TaxID=1314802 RepID=A0A6A6XDB2_9PLEO|nr:hypothetical protein K505DRAFT_324667 [Melanomma pulvis-pyrius CBS 109.77]